MPAALTSRRGQESNGTAVGRPGRSSTPECLVGKSRRGASVQVEDPDGLGGPLPPLVTPVRGEGNAPAVGRPGGAAFVPVAFRQLARIAAGGRDGKEVGAQVINKAGAVQSIEHFGYGTDARQVLPVEGRGIGFRVVRIASRGDKQQRPAIRRPGRRSGAVAHERELPRLSTIYGNDEDLRPAYSTCQVFLAGRLGVSRRRTHEGQRTSHRETSGAGCPDGRW